MNRLLRRANARISLGNAAALLVGVAMLTQLLGFLRTRLISANFTRFDKASTDAFFVAFKIPDFFLFYSYCRRTDSGLFALTGRSFSQR